MAKSSHDLALLSELVLSPQAREKLPADGYLSFTKSTFEGLNIGFVDPEIWRWPETVQPQHGNSLEELVSVRACFICLMSADHEMTHSERAIQMPWNLLHATRQEQYIPSHFPPSQTSC